MTDETTTDLGEAVGNVDAAVRASTTLIGDRLNALRTDLAGIAQRPAASPDEVAGAVAAAVSSSVESAVATATTAATSGLPSAVAAELLPQLSATVTADVRKELEASEARILAYIDSAVLALAETLVLGGSTAKAPAAPRKPAQPAAAAEEPPTPTATDELRPADLRKGRWRTTPSS